jgi:HK97 family phage portal protein
MTGWFARLTGRARLAPAGGARAGSPPGRKTGQGAFAHPHGALIALLDGGAARWSERSLPALAREGYCGNAVAHRCVRLIAEAAAHVPWLVFDGDRELEDHPLARLLARPNREESGRTLFERFHGYLQVYGNAYIEAVGDGEGAIRELHLLRPDRVRVVAGSDGWPEAFDYTVDGRTSRIVQAGAPPPVLHAKLFHPLDDHYGLAPAAAAARAIDIHNASAAWSKALIDNAARPSGALVYRGANGDMNLTEEQFDRLKGELEASHQGAINAGRPMILEGGLEWLSIAHSPRDMEHLEVRHAAAREIALGFGVPPLMLGLPGDNTYANYAEANRAFYRSCVLPLAERTAEAVSHWLAPAFGGGVRLAPDLDRIEALSTERAALWARVGAATFLTEDEKRTAVGYGVNRAGAGR